MIGAGPFSHYSFDIARAQQGPAAPSAAPGSWEPQSPGCHGRDVTSQGPVPQEPHEVSEAGPEMAARLKQESRSSGVLVVMRRVRGQAGKPIHRSRSA